MTYIVATQVRAEDPAAFRSHVGSLVRPKLTALGAQYVAALESLAGGEGTGLFTMGSRWDSLDTAMNALATFYADPDVTGALEQSPAEVVGRSIGVVEGEVGETTGTYAGIGMARAESATPEGVAELMKNLHGIGSAAGCGGVRIIRNVAGGEQTGSWAGLVYTDSLDAYASALAGVADSQEMATCYEEMGIIPVGRVICRCH